MCVVSLTKQSLTTEDDCDHWDFHPAPGGPQIFAARISLFHALAIAYRLTAFAYHTRSRENLAFSPQGIEP